MDHRTDAMEGRCWCKPDVRAIHRVCGGDGCDQCQGTGLVTASPTQSGMLIISHNDTSRGVNAVAPCCEGAMTKGVNHGPH